MTEQFLTVNGGGLSANNKNLAMIKTYSFTTDEDDGTTVANSQLIPNHQKLLSINSLSIDGHTNGDDASESDVKIKKRKSRRQTHPDEGKETKQASSLTKIPFYKRIHLLTPLMFIGTLILLYFMWTKRDVWISRFLGSNPRIRRFSLAKNEQLNKDSSASFLYSSATTTTTKISLEGSLKDSSNKQQNFIEKSQEKNNIDTSSLKEESIPSPTKSPTPQKLNIRTRRNKMSFSKERPKKKHHRLQGSSTDDDDDDDDDGYETDDDDDDDDQEEDKSINITEKSITFPTDSTKTNHQRSTIPKKNLESFVALKSPFNLSNYDFIIEQLRKSLKRQIRHQEFFSTLSKTSGLNKQKLHRFIYKKDYQLLTLQTFLALLDSFNLMLLIVPK